LLGRPGEPVYRLLVRAIKTGPIIPVVEARARAIYAIMESIVEAVPIVVMIDMAVSE
jgi:hypothetical protein